MSTNKSRVPSLLCDMCGHVFRPGDTPTCRALVAGKKWCNPDVLKRELQERLMPADIHEAPEIHLEDDRGGG